MVVQWLISRLVCRGHGLIPIHSVIKSGTLYTFGMKTQFLVNPGFRMGLNARFTRLSKQEEEKTIMEGNSMRQRNLPPADGKLVTILSIDGGGVRGIIAGVILAKLEEQLQVINYIKTVL